MFLANEMNEYAVSKWILKIHIVPKKYKSQQIGIKSHTKY